MTEAIVEFITARLAEVEAHARKDLHLIAAATPLDQWTVGHGYNLPFSEIGDSSSIARVTSTYGRRLADGEPDQHRADATLIGRMVRRSAVHAERTLRDVEAKRAVLTMHEAMRLGAEAAEGTVLAGAARVRLGAYRNALQALAAAWNDHPDYRSEWSP